MWVIVHALSGLALGAILPISLGPLLVCAVVLHALLDLVPHWDYTGTRRSSVWAVSDVVLAIVAVSGLTLGFDLSAAAIAAAIVSAAPDLDVLDAVLPGRPRRRWFPSHWRTFPHGHARPRSGIAVQAVVVMASVAAVALAG